MKLSVVITSRNDNYGGNLLERSTYCLNSMIDTFDEVWYVDWNSPLESGSLLNSIKPNLQLRGNLNHIVVTPETAMALVNNDVNMQVCCEVLGRNLGIRRATGDVIVSSNIDIIAPRRADLEEMIKNSDPNTFYTISRRPLDLSHINETWNELTKDIYPGDPSSFSSYNCWKELRDYFVKNSEERHYKESVVQGEDYSIINCCGDFQLARRHVWEKIRGFEEELIYALYTDTNIQKKAVMHGFGLKALYNPALFHINHGKGGGGFLDGINKRVNDMQRAIIYQHETQNPDTWGFSNIEVEYETL
jgi:hypothetical protein